MRSVVASSTCSAPPLLESAIGQQGSASTWLATKLELAISRSEPWSQLPMA